MQSKFESCSIKLSKAIGDEVGSASAHGKTFTAADRLKAINRARGKVYTRILNEVGIDTLIKAYPEFVKRADKVLQPIKESDIRKVIKIYEDGIVDGVPVQQYFNSLYDSMSQFRVSGVNKFAEYGEQVEILNLIPS